MDIKINPENYEIVVKPIKVLPGELRKSGIF